MAPQKRSHRNDGTDRLLNELRLRSLDRRIPVCANYPDRAQSALLPGVDRELRFHERKRLVCVVVQRYSGTDGAVAQNSNRALREARCRNPVDRLEEANGRESALARSF